MIRGLVAVAVWMIVAVPAMAGWVRRYEPLKGSHVDAVASLPDGGAMVLSGGLKNVLFTTNATGDVVAARQLERQAWFVVRGTGNSIFAGGVQLRVNDGPELQVAKLDAKLAVTWTARYVSRGDDSFQPSAASATANGGLLIGGAVQQWAYAFVMRLGADGRVEWARRLDASNHDNVVDLIETRDGGVVLAGYSRDSPWLAKLSAKGELEWQQIYRAASGGFDSVVETADGDLIAAGSSVLIVRITSTGATKWQKALTQHVESSTLVRMPNDWFALSLMGKSASWLLTFRGDGSLVWQQSFTPGDGVIVSNPSFGATDLASAPTGLFYAPPLRRRDDSWDGATFLFRIDADGKTGCPWFMPSNIPIADVTIRPESLPMVVEPLVFEELPWVTKFAEVQTVAAPITCAAAPLAASPAPSAVPPARTSTFDPKSILNTKALLWDELLRKKDFKQLENIAAELRRKPWSSDPLHWDIGRFYEVLGTTQSMDEANVLATLREWIAAQPRSISPKIALVQALYAAAWKRRGTGFSDTVTNQDWAAYEKLLDESYKTLTTISAAENDPHYWTLSVRLARGSSDPLAIARNAAKYTHNPDVFAYATVNLLPQWSDRLAELRPFAEEAAALTRTTMGESIYTWLAYQAQFLMGEQQAETLGFEWPRVRQGARDLIRIAPAWNPTYHRLALMARRANDRATAREMFQREELDWYEGATSMWPSRLYYDAARDWALRTPAEAFIDSASKPTPLAASTSAPKSTIAPAPAPQKATSATKLKRAPASGAVSASLPSLPPTQWPQIVMANDVVIAGAAQPRAASFLVETRSGVVAISALPDVLPAMSRENLTEYIRSRLTTWTMVSPAHPKRVMKVQAIDTQNAPDFQRGVALALAAIKGDLPTHVLKVYSPEAAPGLGNRVFVVACEWTAERCTQIVVQGKLSSSDSSTDKKRVTYFITLDKALDVTTIAGAAVLDEDGYAIAVMNGRSSSFYPAGCLDAEDLRSVVTR